MSLVINIFGDFKCDSVSSLEVGSPLKEILAQGDINVLNFEAPVKVEGSSLTPKCGPSLFQDPEAPVFLEKLGFDFVSLANNHMGDFCFDLPGSADWPFWGNGLIASLSVGDDMSVKVSVCHSFYDPDSGVLTAGNVDQNALDRVRRIMDVFSDESRYLENVRATAASFEKSFERSVFMAGYGKMNLRNSLKGIARWILGRKVGTDFNPLLDVLPVSPIAGPLRSC